MGLPGLFQPLHTSGLFIVRIKQISVGAFPFLESELMVKLFIIVFHQKMSAAVCSGESISWTPERVNTRGPGFQSLTDLFHLFLLSGFSLAMNNGVLRQLYWIKRYHDNRIQKKTCLMVPNLSWIMKINYIYTCTFINVNVYHWYN